MVVKQFWYEFGGLRMCSTSASIDSNRAVDCKVTAVCLYRVCLVISVFLDACVFYKSVFM